MHSQNDQQLIRKLEQVPTQLSHQICGRFEITEQDSTTQQLPDELFATSNNNKYNNSCVAQAPLQLYSFYLPQYPTLYNGDNTGTLQLTISHLPPQSVTIKLCGNGLLFKPSTIVYKHDSMNRDAEFAVTHISCNNIQQPITVAIQYTISGCDSALYSVPQSDSIIILPTGYNGILCSRCVLNQCTEHDPTSSHRSPVKPCNTTKYSDPIARKYNELDQTINHKQAMTSILLQSPAASPVVTRKSGRFYITEDQQLINQHDINTSSTNSLYDSSASTNIQQPQQLRSVGLPDQPIHNLLPTALPPVCNHNNTTPSQCSPLDLLGQLYTQVNQLIHENNVLKHRNDVLTNENVLLQHTINTIQPPQSSPSYDILNTSVHNLPNISRSNTDNTGTISKHNTRWDQSSSLYQSQKTNQHMTTNTVLPEQECKQYSPLLTALPIDPILSQPNRLISVDYLTNTCSPLFTPYKANSAILDNTTMLSLNPTSTNTKSHTPDMTTANRTTRYATLQQYRNGDKQNINHVLNQLRGSTVQNAVQSSDLLNNI